jgi:uncharacterized protein YjgD (DUF1641 family)
MRKPTNKQEYDMMMCEFNNLKVVVDKFTKLLNKTDVNSPIYNLIRQEHTTHLLKMQEIIVAQYNYLFK